MPVLDCTELHYAATYNTVLYYDILRQRDYAPRTAQGVGVCVGVGMGGGMGGLRVGETLYFILYTL